VAFKRFSVCVDDETYKILTDIVNNTDSTLAEVSRNLIKKGLASDWVDENTDLISRVVRQQMEIVVKPHVERLAKLSAKSGHMSATAAFLNVQALMDIVPTEKRKDVRPMYESARKKAAEYMKVTTEEWDYSLLEKETEVK
jgi:hypothetical protein